MFYFKVLLLFYSAAFYMENYDMIITNNNIIDYLIMWITPIKYSS